MVLIAQISTMTMIATRRASVLAKGSRPPKAIKGPRNQTSEASRARPRNDTTQRFNSQPNRIRKILMPSPP
jgi:hypothetical protein